LFLVNSLLTNALCISLFVSTLVLLRLWSPYLKRWVIGSERLASLGWPVHPTLASVAGCKVSNFDSTENIKAFAGNSYHVAVAGVVKMVGLSCTRLL
jgi:4-hydroxybenzoate polyprenyltransferase